MGLFVGKMRRASLLGLGAAVIAIALVGWMAYRATSNADMLRLAPDELPSNAGLFRFAVAEGAGVFENHCASCHGATLKGDRRQGVPDLTDGEWLFGEGRVSEIEQIALYGIRAGIHRTKNAADMPAFGRETPYARYQIPTLTPAEISDLADYIGTFQGRPADAASRERGKALFDVKGQCFDCHSGDLAGDNFIGAPNLADKVWLYGDGSHQSIVNSIAQGRQGVSPMFKNRLKPAQLRAVAAFIHAKSTPHPAA